MKHRATFWALLSIAFTASTVFSQTVFSTSGAVNLTEANGAIFFNGTCSGTATQNVVSRKFPGGFNSTIYTVACGSFNTVSRISVDEEGWLYWINRGGTLRAHQSGSSGSSENRGEVATASLLPPEAPTAVGSAYFFWTEAVGGEFSENGNLYSTLKSGGGGTPVTIYDGPGTGVVRGDFIWLYAISDTNLLGLTRFGTLFNFRRTTIFFPVINFSWATHIIGTNIQQANFGDGRVWFAQENSGANRVEIRSLATADLPNGASTEHARLAANAEITALDGDENNVFFYNKPFGASGGSLFRKARGTSVASAPDNIAGPTPAADELNIVGRQVIWRESFNRTLTIDADAVAFTRNLRFARQMEAVQVVQNSSASVSMVRRKETYVRVYPELASTSVPGETSLNFWPNVILHGEDSDGNRLFGSPLNPLFGSREFEFIMDPRRENMDEIAMFRLPIEWTNESSPITLRCEVNPSRLIAESTYADNTRTRTVTFRHKAPVEMIVHPLRTTDGVIKHYRPQYQPMIDRAEAIMPTDRLLHFWPGGIVMEEYEFPFSFGPYEFTQGENDSWKVLTKLQFRQLIFKPLNLFSPLQVRSAGLFIGDDPRNGLNGVAMWDVFLNKTSNVVGAPVARGANTFNSGISGVTMAHEIGHTFFRSHVDCPAGAPAGIDSSYPYDPCNISNNINGNIGWDPLSQQQIVFDAAGDLMSYAHQNNRPRWPSSYTYNAMLSNFDNLPFRPGTTGDKAGEKGGGGKEWIVFGGWTDGTPEIHFMQPVTGNDLVTATDFYDNTPGDRGSFHVRGLDVIGNLVVMAGAVVTEGSEDSGPLGFTAMLPENNSIVRVEFVATSAPNTPLAFRESGPAIPTVAITAPTPGAAPTGNLNISWNGSDADGDRLHYTVQLSRDGVSNWQTLIEITPDTSISVDLTTFGGNSSKCRVRVIASDGIHCTIARSGTFTLPDAPPEIYTFYDAGRGRKCDHLGPIVAEAGATIIVSATALDPEDGMVTGNDIAWRLTGPVTRNGIGTRWDMADLPPGIYSLRCTATTSSGQTAVDTRTLEVLPKEVPDAASLPVLDGWPDEAAWTADRRPVTFTYGSGERATVRMVHHDGNLYVGVSGLPKGRNARQFFALTFHPDSGGGTTTTADDQRFSFYLDGEITRSVGTGTSFIRQDTLGGFQARIAANDDFWAIEACIPEATLGGWNDQIVRIGVGHYHRNFSGDDTFWPANGFWNQPGTWGLVRFGEPNPPPVDDDGDGLLDEWELTSFSTLNRDGLGDSDGDGQTDMAEFLAGTNPRSAASGLKFAEAMVVGGAGGGVTIQWDSADGPTYDLYGSPHPAGPYTLVQRAINSTPPMNSFTIPPPLVDLRFFRISTTPLD